MYRYVASQPQVEIFFLIGVKSSTSEPNLFVNDFSEFLKRPDSQISSFHHHLSEANELP